MKAKLVPVFILGAWLITVQAYSAQDEMGWYPVPAATAAEEPIPPGMEKKEIGGAQFVVPKGTRVTKRGDLIVLETIEAYVARTLADMRESLATLELGLSELNEKVDILLTEPKQQSPAAEQDDKVKSEPGTVKP